MLHECEFAWKFFFLPKEPKQLVRGDVTSESPVKSYLQILSSSCVWKWIGLLLNRELLSEEQKGQVGCNRPENWRSDHDKA